MIYVVWRRAWTDTYAGGWIVTSHRLHARSDKEARSRLKRKFAKARFHHMALVAVPLGQSPDDNERKAV